MVLEQLIPLDKQRDFGDMAHLLVVAYLLFGGVWYTISTLLTWALIYAYVMLRVIAMTLPLVTY